MLPLRTGTIIYSSFHGKELCCCGKNGARHDQYLGHEIKNGKQDKNTLRLFTLQDIEAVRTDDGLQMVLPGSVTIVS